MGAKGVLRFTTAYLNLNEVFSGNGGLSTSTGVFTAPVGGLYSFTVTALAVTNKVTGIALRRNRHNLAYASSTDNQMSMTISTVLLLKANDKVDVYLVQGKVNGGAVLNKAAAIRFTAVDFKLLFGSTQIPDKCDELQTH
ncbi:Oidioi.mRNA.OKI2018_I69.PAR.g12837.t1.cds [Oikopleura dioica]|uniref:Oidioi.mRNA.OKI2018_I69.PAR.g12837.t1.cds n=1 Tax=Oikopleura dioica TaxID=34765 RepID=A0ABN7S5Q8_OIKDI|nr:Oidioi.mRNA.OKI2018_I69.PAR.g12837.t1.cds [Oikopleura dioica]